MPTIEDLIRAVDQLPASELDDFVQRVLILRARRRAPALDLTEAQLLQRINQELPRDNRDRYRELMKLRDAQALTAEQYQELLQLTDQVEKSQANCVEALVELAQLRNVSVDQLMDQLGFRPTSQG